MKDDVHSSDVEEGAGAACLVLLWCWSEDDQPQWCLWCLGQRSSFGDWRWLWYTSSRSRPSPEHGVGFYFWIWILIYLFKIRILIFCIQFGFGFSLLNFDFEFGFWFSFFNLDSDFLFLIWILILFFGLRSFQFVIELPVWCCLHLTHVDHTLKQKTFKFILLLNEMLW